MRRINGNRQQRFPQPHPLKEEFRKRKITLWMIRNMTDVVESQLSRYFNGIDQMPKHLEDSLYKLYFTLDGRPNEWERIQKISSEALRTMEKTEEDKEALLRKNVDCKSKEEQS